MVARKAQLHARMRAVVGAGTQGAITGRPRGHRWPSHLRRDATQRDLHEASALLQALPAQTGFSMCHQSSLTLRTRSAPMDHAVLRPATTLEALTTPRQSRPKAPHGACQSMLQ